MPSGGKKSDNKRLSTTAGKLSTGAGSKTSAAYGAIPQAKQRSKTQGTQVFDIIDQVGNYGYCGDNGAAGPVSAIE